MFVHFIKKYKYSTIPSICFKFSSLFSPSKKKIEKKACKYIENIKENSSFTSYFKNELSRPLYTLLLIFFSISTTVLSQEKLTSIKGKPDKQVLVKEVNKDETNNFVIVRNASVISAGKSKSSSSTFAMKMAAPTIDLNTATPGNDHFFQYQPPGGSVTTVTVSPSVTSDTNTIVSATITITGVLDNSNEELFAINDGGFDLYYFNNPLDTNDYVYSGSTIRVTQTTATTFSITEASGNPIPNADFEQLLSNLYYGDLASPYTDGDRVITVTITDASAATASAQTTIRVYTTAPTVNDEGNSIAANSTGTVTGNVLTNDSGSSIFVSEVDVYPTAVGTAYSTLYGTVTIQSNGSYSYDVDETSSSVTGLRNGESLQDIVSYTVEDSNGVINYGILTITINGVDESPVALDNTDSVTAFVEPSTSGNIITDPGPSGSDAIDRGLSTLVWENEFVQGGTFVGLSDPISGASVVIDGVTLNFTSTDPSGFGIPNQNQVVYLTNTNGGHTGYFGYAIDGTVNPSSDTVLTINFSQPVYNLGFLVVDIDFSQGNSWQDLIRIQGSLSGSNSSYKYVTTGGIVDAGGNTFYGIGSAVPGDATGNINVFFEEPIDQLVLSYNYGPNATAANQGGQIAGVSDIYWQGSAIGITISQIDGGAVGVGGTTFTGTYGSVTVFPDGSYTYVPDTSNPTIIDLKVGQTVTDTFTYTLTDGISSDNADLIITINGSDTVPTANDDTATVAEDGSVSITVSTNDDIGGDGGDGEDYSLLAGPTNGTVTETADGVFSYTPNAD
ncbi:VCBS repeat-containing protein, partial [Tenacibaculum skagerrakense]